MGRASVSQPGGKIGRFADDRLLLGRPLADKVAHDDHACGDADPGCERLAGRGRQTSDCLNGRQAGPHGALGLVLVRRRPPEIGEHPVAH